MRIFTATFVAIAIAAAGSPAFAAKKKSSSTRVEQAVVEQAPMKKRGCSKGGFRSRSGGSGAAYWSSQGAQGDC